MEITQNDLDAADTTARREKLASTNYDALIAQHDSEEQSARSRQTRAEQELAEAQRRLEEKRAASRRRSAGRMTRLPRWTNRPKPTKKALDAQRKTAASSHDTAREELLLEGMGANAHHRHQT